MGLELQCSHSICYPLMEIARTHNNLDPKEPHVVADRVAHARQSKGATSALEFLNETEQLIACTNVDEVDLTKVEKHPLYLRSHR